MDIKKTNNIDPDRNVADHKGIPQENLLSDQEFADLMDAEMRAEARSGPANSGTSIDEIAKQRNWRAIDAHLDKVLSKRGLKGILIQAAGIAAALAVSVGTVTLLQQRDTETLLTESGVKGDGTISAPATVAVFVLATGKPLFRITDGIAPGGVDLVFRVNASQPGHTGIFVQFYRGEETTTAGHVSDTPQNPTDETLVTESGEIVRYRLSQETPAFTVCALAAKKIAVFKQLIDIMKSSETPQLTGIVDPESACTSVRMDMGKPE